jgi:nucleotide-binding universal stress UspA family protein
MMEPAMPVDRKVVTVFLDASPSGQKRAAHAASLAQRWHAYLVGAHVVFEGMKLPQWPPPMPLPRSDGALGQLVDYRNQLYSDAEAASARVREHFATLCAGLKVAGEFRPIGPVNSIEKTIRIAFLSDLVIVGRPGPNGLPDALSVEKLLFASGAPLLIVPNAWKGETIGNNVLIGWNATREARRAVGDAMAFLVSAKSVTVLVVDPDGSCQNCEELSSDIALHLDRHGARVDRHHVPSHGFSTPAVLLAYAEEEASDLLVVGAYSQSRLRAFFLGGTTRTLLAKTTVPILMSR